MLLSASVAEAESVKAAYVCNDENSNVHAILTNDNLLDGTIETSSEQYYVEPAHRYSSDLPASGVHSIIYKVSDVHMDKSAAASPTTSSPAEHCASERLKRSLMLDDLKRRLSSGEELRWRRKRETHVDENNNNLTLNRQKRWLPDELSINEQQNPPLPLDLDVPYNDDFSIFTHYTNRDNINNTKSLNKSISNVESIEDNEKTPQQASVITWRNAVGASETGFTPSIAKTTNATRNRNIIVSNYNPNGGESNANYNNNNNNSVRKTYTKHKNIIVSTYNNNNNNNNNNKNNNPNFNRSSTFGRNDDPFDSNGNFVNNFFNTNWTTMFVGNDRPSHKTHVEIITKNGATKKPNIIVNNYNPEIMMAPNPHNPNFNSMLMTNLLSGRGQDNNRDAGSGSSMRSLYDRKITCMLYLQADHTFFQKMGSDEASIEAITRHVQRANSIYKNTDFNNDGKPDNITFMIKRIKVHNMNAVKDPAYRFPGNYGVEKFLELFSEEDYDAFCLAYMFTYRDFEMGTLGLAWTGDLKNAGGVCEKNGFAYF
ncbi:putative mediator of RNA polymerase II transcription subunit 24 [Teleopsis dalmanni]|uniref:putative mediator of RNA polymerase II transcription subunit 24 n=1 Tax=Teleopsis dalmanni TaxID=139649 RepID=UPI0018CD2E47|nr:putative mediator of RNA polymerase II transcription subunit 24 [Teleopsis dalmanni]